VSISLDKLNPMSDTQQSRATLSRNFFAQANVNFSISKQSPNKHDLREIHGQVNKQLTNHRSTTQREMPKNREWFILYCDADAMNVLLPPTMTNVILYNIISTNFSTSTLSIV